MTSRGQASRTVGQQQGIILVQPCASLKHSYREDAESGMQKGLGCDRSVQESVPTRRQSLHTTPCRSLRKHGPRWGVESPHLKTSHSPDHVLKVQGLIFVEAMDLNDCGTSMRMIRIEGQAGLVPVR